MPNFLPKRARSCSPPRPSSPLSQVPGRWCSPVASCHFVKSRHVATSWVPAEWMEVPAAWDVVEPRVTHNSCATLEQWARSDCLIMFLDGTGEPFFKSSPSGCSGFHRRVRAVNGRGGGLPGVEQTVPRSEIYAGIGALRSAPRKNPLVLISDDEYFVSTAQKGRAHRARQWSVLWQTVLGRGRPLWQSRFSKSRASEWSRWSGHQPIWMFAWNEFADRLAAKEAETHQHSE